MLRTVSESLSPAPGRVSLEAGPNRAQLSFEDRRVSPILHRKLSFEEPNGTLLFEERRVSTISERQNGNVAEDIIVVETTFVN